ncbi:MAG: hypothetical protein JWP40_3840 [Blastococcus sp.]|jgi:hypothetical protein|nr:hypothetical protein [Blastococcus sp.]
MTRRRYPVFLPVLLLGLSACGSHSLTATSVATGAENALEKQVGTRPTVSCPNDLDARVGATTRCTLTAGSDPTKYGVTVTVTSVKDANATFDVKVDTKPVS